MSQMKLRVTSKDGTTIAYDRQGSGPAVILVGGGLDDGSENAPMASVLAEHFTVYNYARRGRGDSDDTPPYAVEREIEDLDALIAMAGGSAHLYGVSSGGGLALEAAAAGTAVDKIAVYEVPYAIDDDLRPRFERYIAETQRAYVEGRHDDMLELFMRLTGASDEDIQAGRNSPYWALSVALAHTLIHDPVFQNGYRLPADRLSGLTQPVLVVTGGTISQPYMAGLPADFFDRAADAIAATVPNAVRQTLERQGHVVDPEAMAPLFRTFLSQ